MASTGKKGKKNKGKTVPLNDFLSNTTISWSDQPDEPDKFGDFLRKPALPAAPRAARALEIDESKIPKNPPYVAYVSNLSYELQDGDIANAFAGLNVTNVRLPRDERSGRLKGFGYVEFGDRDSFISALLKYEVTIRGRRIKIDVAESEGERRRGGPRDFRDRDSNYDSERTMGDWRAGPKRSEFLDDGRSSLSGRKDYGGFRDRDGYDKGRSEESSWRGSERRFGGDRENRSFGGDRDNRFGSRRNYSSDADSLGEPKQRTKLNLIPRTKPIEEIVVKEQGLDKNEDRLESEKEKEKEKEKSSASIFGQAKPVDTAAREREIEQRLEREREGVKIDKEFDKSKPKSEDESNTDVKRVGPPESKENIWVRKSLRQDAQNLTSRDSSSGRKENDSNEPDEKEPEKKNAESPDDSSRFGSSRRNDDYDSDHDNDSRYSRYNKSDNRYNDRNRDGDRSYGRDDRDRRDRDRRDYDRRDRGYDSDWRPRDNMSRGREKDRDTGDSRRHDREGDSRRYNDREGDSRRYNDREGDSRRYNDREGDSRRYNDREGDSKRYNDREGDYKRYNDRENDWRESSNDNNGDGKRGQDREGDRYRDQDDHGGNKGLRGDKRPGPGAGDKGPRSVKYSQDRDRGPQTKEKPRDPQKKPEDGLRLPKLKETAAPNYIGTNKYSFLDDDGISE